MSGADDDEARLAVDRERGQPVRHHLIAAPVHAVVEELLLRVAADLREQQRGHLRVVARLPHLHHLAREGGQVRRVAQHVREPRLLQSVGQPREHRHLLVERLERDDRLLALRAAQEDGVDAVLGLQARRAVLEILHDQRHQPRAHLVDAVHRVLVHLHVLRHLLVGVGAHDLLQRVRLGQEAVAIGRLDRVDRRRRREVELDDQLLRGLPVALDARIERDLAAVADVHRAEQVEAAAVGAGHLPEERLRGRRRARARVPRRGRLAREGEHGDPQRGGDARAGAPHGATTSTGPKRSSCARNAAAGPTATIAERSGWSSRRAAAATSSRVTAASRVR
jgi:hypothetical protein